MRILYSHRIQSRDGQSVHVEEMVAAFRAAGHEVLVVGPGFYDRAKFGAESSLIARLRARLPNVVSELGELAYNIPAYWRLRRAARRFQPDLIYERYNLFHLAGLWLAHRQKLLLYLEVNAPLAEERTRFAGLRLRRLAHFLEGTTWRAADRVLAVTAVLKDMIAAKGVPAERIEVTPNAIDPIAFTALTERPVAPTPLVLGFVGFVRAWHGLDTVIRAMARAPDAASLALTVVGDGPARQELQALAQREGIADRVHFTGLASRDTIPGLVAGFDIALQPRVVAYASPLKIFEYMAAGKAVVAPNQPNIREILTDGETALLFNPEDDGDLWHAITRLLHDPALRHRLGTAGRAEIMRRDYTWAGNAARVIAWAQQDRKTAR